MKQTLAFGEAEVAVLIQIKKADGRILYYRVVDNQNIEIDETTYLSLQEE